MRGGFHRAAGFAGKNEQRFYRVNAGADGINPVGVGGIQDNQFRPAVLFAKYGAEHFRGQGRTAHPHDYTMLEIGFCVLRK